MFRRRTQSRDTELPLCIHSLQSLIHSKILATSYNYIMLSNQILPINHYNYKNTNAKSHPTSQKHLNACSTKTLNKDEGGKVIGNRAILASEQNPSTRVMSYCIATHQEFLIKRATKTPRQLTKQLFHQTLR